MRLLLDGTARLVPGRDRGIGRYLAALDRANADMGNEVTEFTTRMHPSRTGEFLALGSRSNELLRRRFDVFHAPTAYYSAIDLKRRPAVVSVLDVIPLDLRHHRRTGVKAQIFHRLSSRADAVLTLSSHAAGRINALLSVPMDRIIVAPLPPGDAFRTGLTSLVTSPQPYVAMLMDLRTPDPRKRMEWIPEIGRHLGSKGVRLVVAGAGTDSLDLPGVVGMGRVTDDEWARTLSGASCLLYCSSYEGQGMPPIEAIACGTPVVAMSNTAIPEVVGAAGILLRENHSQSDALELADTAASVSLDSPLRKSLADSCAAQASLFTQERFTAGVSCAYEKACHR